MGVAEAGISDGVEIDTIYRLEFENRPGVWVRLREPSLGLSLSLDEMGASDSVSGTDYVRAAAEALAAHLIDWNLVRLSHTIAATYAGLLSLGHRTVMMIFKEWMAASTGIPDDLGKELPSGERFPGGEIPMETLSPNPLSTPGP